MHHSQKIGNRADFRSKRRGRNVVVNKVHHHYYPNPNTVTPQIPTATQLGMTSAPLPPISAQIPVPPIPAQMPVPPIPAQISVPPISAQIPTIPAQIPVPPIPAPSQLPPLPPHLRLPHISGAPVTTQTQMNGNAGYGAVRGQAGASYPVSTYNNPSILPIAPPAASYRHHPYRVTMPMTGSEYATTNSSTVSSDGKIDVNDIYENYEVKRLRSENIRLQALVEKSEAERKRKKAEKKEKKKRKKARAKQRSLDNDNDDSTSNSTKSLK